jgi:hypothetical protein
MRRFTADYLCVLFVCDGANIDLEVSLDNMWDYWGMRV